MRYTCRYRVGPCGCRIKYSYDQSCEPYKGHALHKCEFTTNVSTNQINLLLPSQFFINCYAQMLLCADRLNTMFVYCDGDAFISRCHMLRAYYECMCFTIMNSHIIFDAPCIEVTYTDLYLGFNHFQFFTGSMCNSIISVYICVRLQLKWHVIYKYKEENRSQHGALRYTAFDWLSTWHFQPIYDTLRSVWKVWFKPAKRW